VHHLKLRSKRPVTTVWTATEAGEIIT